jgi:hypothetical protein
MKPIIEGPRWFRASVAGAVIGLSLALVAFISIGRIVPSLLFGLAWGVFTGVFAAIRLVSTKDDSTDGSN